MGERGRGGASDEEPLEDAALKFQYLNRPISVYLDGTLLYSDIPGTPEQGVEFLPPDAGSFKEQGCVQNVCNPAG